MSPSDRTLESVAAEATARGEAVKTDPGVVWHYTDGPGLLSYLAAPRALGDFGGVPQRQGRGRPRRAADGRANPAVGGVHRLRALCAAGGVDPERFGPGRRAVAVAVLHPERLAVMGLLGDVAVVRRCPGVVRDRPGRDHAAVGAPPARP